MELDVDRGFFYFFLLENVTHSFAESLTNDRNVLVRLIQSVLFLCPVSCFAI